MKRPDLKAILQQDRRRFLRFAGGTLVWLGAPQFGGSSHLEKRALAQGAVPHRFLQIFLQGGWDSYLATDPVIGSKQSSGAYEAIYASKESRSVTGKSNLIVGEGLIPAIEAFATLPTAFINGLYVEVTAHELATTYMLTGQQTLTRDYEPTAFIATAAEAAAYDPPHVVLGGILPLGATRSSAPPLQSQNIGGLGVILKAPESGIAMQAGSGAIAQKLTEDLNRLRFGTAVQSATGQAWLNAEQGIMSIYEKNYASSLEFNTDLQARYGSTEAGSAAGMMAGAYLVLKSGLSPYVSIFTHGFDTHTEGLDVQLSRQQDVARALKVLVQDLAQTPDPTYPQASLAETTTILITSEFVRTPKFNLISGSDHWQSSSAILMGKGIRDNSIVGKTGDDAKAMGWVDNQAQVFNEDSRILPDHLAASVLRLLGFPSLAKSEKLGRLDAAFL